MEAEHERKVEDQAAQAYSISARFYDLMYDAVQSKLDVPFYLELAHRHSGPVLELGCGTGRVALPLARAGSRITGLDLSEPMLDRLRLKLSAETADVRDRVTVVSGGMTDFQFSERFDLVLSPFRAFQHIMEPALQRRCLERIAAHLTPGGRFVFNAFNPDLKYIVDAMSLPACWQQVNEAADPDAGEIIRRYVQLRPDPRRQVHQLGWKYEIYDRSERLRETHVERMEMRWLYRWEAEYLLELCGLEITEAYGGYDRRPLDDRAGELIYVCKRRN